MTRKDVLAKLVGQGVSLQIVAQSGHIDIYGGVKNPTHTIRAVGEEMFEVQKNGETRRVFMNLAYIRQIVL